MMNNVEKYVLNECDNLKEGTMLLRKRVQDFNELKSKLEEHFGFEIEGYIIDDILDNEKYHHICLIINLAVMNKKLTEENGEILKKGLKELFEIKNDYDRLRKNVFISDYDFKKWSEKYHNHAFIDLKNNFTDEDIDIFKKLGIEITDKLYTEYEHELVDMDLIAYYRNEKEMGEEELKESKTLPADVTREEYDRLLEKFDKVSEKYKV